MSNEAQAAKPLSKSPESIVVKRDAAERIPLKWIRWERTMPLPGPASEQSLTQFGRPPENTGRPYYLGHFVPEHQTIEIHYFQGDPATPPEFRRYWIGRALAFE